VFYRTLLYVTLSHPCANLQSVLAQYINLAVQCGHRDGLWTRSVLSEKYRTCEIYYKPKPWMLGSIQYYSADSAKSRKIPS